MTIYTQKGSISLSDLQNGKKITLLHGGSGPADPKGPKAQTAATALNSVLENISSPEAQTYESSLLLEHKKMNHATGATKAEIRAVKAAYLLEHNPCFNAGYGAALQSDGVARVSASFMESTRQKFSAVMNCRDIINPSKLAFLLQHEKFCVLDSTGARNLIHDLKLPTEDLATVERLEAYTQSNAESQALHPFEPDGKGTIGAVVVDCDGHLAAVTSTGGVGFETVGRVGDTPTVAGNFCTHEVAISCTGYGEQIVNSALAAAIATRVADGFSLVAAVEKSLLDGQKKGYEF
ncbi:isoaspartyl peptidase/L-asparaginase, partial [Myxococcota bacterium]|nr:isoaspartyl peptidase/L-asparaginase [Myxococcota bacterium]